MTFIFIKGRQEADVEEVVCGIVSAEHLVGLDAMRICARDQKAHLPRIRLIDPTEQPPDPNEGIAPVGAARRRPHQLDFVNCEDKRTANGLYYSCQIMIEEFPYRLGLGDVREEVMRSEQTQTRKTTDGSVRVIDRLAEAPQEVLTRRINGVDPLQLHLRDVG